MPPLDLYCRKAHADVQWWVKRLSTENREEIRSLCGDEDFEAMEDRPAFATALVDELLAAAPQAREKILQGIDQSYRLAVMLMACHQTRCAWILFSALAEHDAFEATTAGAAREMIRRGGRAARDFLDHAPAYWPFEEDPDEG